MAELAVEVRHRGETAYALDVRDGRGRLLSVPFDPRDDGPHVYAKLDVWTEPPGEPLAAGDRDAVIDALVRGLDVFFAHDLWTLWTASWPRFPLRWKGAHDHVVLLEGTRRLLYGEPGRGLVLDAVERATRKPGVRRVAVALPPAPRWSYPEDGEPIDDATWARILARIRSAPDLEVVTASEPEPKSKGRRARSRSSG